MNAHVGTHSGRLVGLIEPTPKAIEIDDIARALSRESRFGGHTVGGLYSVAQHSVLCSRHCAPEAALAALMHDAAEAYMGDLTRPFKALVRDKAKKVETNLWRSIRERYRLGPFSAEVIAEVKRIDEVLLATEARDLMLDAQSWEGADSLPQPLSEPIDIWCESWSYLQFLRRWKELRG